ncbi:hypothetical protein L1049_010366 [Liquidambar formosana]|uniref:THH1/TOM1/TOM3 domain-containing protein n=1 Tax=Liquidambar formosana TaxID=63359 RepID=A0AAP0R4C4_LIQFO
MMFGLREDSCLRRDLVVVNTGLACVDGVIAVLAIWQLIRIHSRDSQLGWTRQKVFHLIIGSSNAGYFVYFVLNLVASCKDWVCWLHSCGFILMACPQILFLAAFLLLLSFWVDLCHQADDEHDEDEECSSEEALLEKTNKPTSLSTDNRSTCFPLRSIHVGSRQKIVILVAVLVFVLMVASAMLIWIGTDSSSVAQVYVDLFAIAIILLGGALAFYGYRLYSKMSGVRSERVSCEMRKVAGLAVVSVLCFTSSAFVALFTPVLYRPQDVTAVKASLLLIVYYFIGASVPSGFVLWIMRELPPSIAANRQEDLGIITFINDSSVVRHPQRWTTATSSQNQRTELWEDLCRDELDYDNATVSEEAGPLHH